MISQLLIVLTDFVIHVIGVLGYPGVFLLMLLESCGIPLPSEATMPFAGFLVSEGRMAFWIVVALGVLGNLVGSLLAYEIGRRGGRPLIEKYGKYLLISKHDLDIADRWFSKRGELMVFVGRLLPVVRTYISFPAGISKMKISRFAFYTVLGCLPWSILFAWLGVKLGENWPLIREKLHNFDLAIAIIIVASVVLYVWRHLRHRKAEVQSV